MRGRGKRTLFRCLAALLLVSPPLVRLGLYLAGAPQGPPPGAEERLRAELAVAREELRRARMDLDFHGLAPREGRHQLLLADVLPLGDPSPVRRAVWIRFRGTLVPPADTAAIWPIDPAGAEAGGGSALAGRLTRPWRGAGLGLVQTLEDPGFRVRFQYLGASGILHGTGAESGGYPLLEIRHLSEAVEIPAGGAVFTEGRDGIYPPGILIGYVMDAPGDAAQKGGRRVVVRGALQAGALDRVAIVVDLAADAARDLGARERRAGGGS